MWVKDANNQWAQVVGQGNLLGVGLSTVWSGGATPDPSVGAVGDVWIPDTPVPIGGGDYVELTGNQTIAGIKTFSSSPIVPTPTTATQAANKSYVDSKITVSTTAPAAPATNDLWVDIS